VTWVLWDRNARINLKKSNLADFGEKRKTNAVSTYGARLSVTKKVAEGRPRARLDAFSEITKKAVATVRFCVNCHAVRSNSGTTKIIKKTFFSRMAFFFF
jgi:hypothetical protein